MPKYLTLFYVIILVVAGGCREGKKYHDDIEKNAQITSRGALAEALEFQEAMNDSFRDPESSPLPDRYRKDFKGLDFFVPDSSYRVMARLVRTPEAEPFLMPTTTARKSKEVRYGIARFILKGQPYELELYQSMERQEDSLERSRLFLPFLDNTNGETTYAGGRYLDLMIPEGDSIVIDFNKAYNPYCAYNKKYSCPIVPRVNFLDTEIRAGVKDFVTP